MAGKVTEVNRKLEDTPALINKDCYAKGWIAKIEVRDMDERQPHERGRIPQLFRIPRKY